METETSIAACIKTREYAAKALAITLKEILNNPTQVSEVKFRDQWLKQLRKNSELFSDGWYIPPPHGLGVLFGTEKDIERISPSSLRPTNMWPKRSVYFDRNNGIVFLYASPVDKKTGIIGDFGLTLYMGNNPHIRNLLKTCYNINLKIFDQIHIGLSFSELNSYTHLILKEYNLVSDLSSPTDPNKTNTGHTIPFILEGWKKEEKKQIEKAKWSDISSMISHKRIFINNSTEFLIKPGMAFTIESRPYSLKNPTLPMVWFHMICIIDAQGNKKLLTNFDEIFNLIGMGYIVS